MMNHEPNYKKHLKVCKARRKMGEKKYEGRSILDMDALSELKEELYDIINYALFTLEKVESMETKLNKIQSNISK